MYLLKFGRRKNEFYMGTAPVVFSSQTLWYPNLGSRQILLSEERPQGKSME
jgi:hypothetical protein